MILPKEFIKSVEKNLKFWNKNLDVNHTLEYENIKLVISFGLFIGITRKYALRMIFDNYELILNNNDSTSWIQILLKLLNSNIVNSNNEIAEINNLLGFLYFSYEKFEKSIKYHLDAFSSNEKIPNNRIFEANFGLCQSYLQMGELILATKHGIKLSMFSINSNKEIMLTDGALLNLLGVLEYANKNNHLFSESLIRSQIQMNNLIIKEGKAKVMNNLAINKLRIKKYRESLSFIGKAKVIFKETEIENEGIDIELFRAIVHIALGQTEESQEIFNRIRNQFDKNQLHVKNNHWENMYSEFTTLFENG